MTSENWTEEMFDVDKIQFSNSVTYLIKDLNGEEIKGSFCEPELQFAKQEVLKIEKVLRRDKKK